MWDFLGVSHALGLEGRLGARTHRLWKTVRPGLACVLAVAALCLLGAGSLTLRAEQAKTTAAAGTSAGQREEMLPLRRDLPPRAAQAQRFLMRRGWVQGRPFHRDLLHGHAAQGNGAVRRPRPESPPPAPTWTAIGPSAVSTPNYGLITGRVSALALDPSDTTGNHLYVGTTGGGVWVANNAGVANTSLISFAPLTDAVPGLSADLDASISIGALTVQPGGTGVILAGTGDPNDALDSYYGVGVLRSTDGGNSWSVISQTADNEWRFLGEGFAGFAWSMVNPQLVVAAVSQAYEGTLVNVDLENRSYEGLYYSSDAGATWSLATISDGSGMDVQGPSDAFDYPDGNAATAVVWNNIRGVFIAAVRFHGYYQSTDGVTWTRMAAQPGTGFTQAACPTNQGSTGSIDCPIFRGSLAVNPQTGDTFAWSVDGFNQDQGLWQDACAINTAGTTCMNTPITFATQWNTTALETDTSNGAATIANGDYNLALAAVPYAPGLGQDTWLLAGADDLWKCSLAAGCVWRNTTNSTTCMSAQVAEFEHALAWDAENPLEIFVGNDGGLWRTLDAIGETGAVCSASDATHFQNLNGGLGSLAEVESLATSSSAQYDMMAGLGVNGTAGLKSATTVNADWPQVLGGNGGPVAIDPANNANWYVNNQAGVAIYFCDDPTACDAAGFGTSPVVNDADVGGDGDVMGVPAPFVVDPLDPSQLLIGTCRVWRGPATGGGWTAANAVSPILDSGALNTACAGDALIRSITAMALSGTTEIVYVGMYGSINGGLLLPGHVLSAVIDTTSSTMPVWSDLTLNPVTQPAGAVNPMNKFGLDISSLFIDSHDATGQTIYATVEGFSTDTEPVDTVYSSTNGGAAWLALTSNLPYAPVSSVVVDPLSDSTVYLATDDGVFFTTAVSNCALAAGACWSAFGSGLPEAPVIDLKAATPAAPAQVLTAATYGRGIWQTALCSASGAGSTSASVNTTQVAFGSQPVGTPTSPTALTVTNTGASNLAVTSVGLSDSADFSETDTCTGASVAPGATCTVSVKFDPQAAGQVAGAMEIYGNVCGGQLTVNLSGTGTSTSVVTMTPATVPFGDVPVGTTVQLPVAVNNSGAAIPISSVSITAPFTIASNACGTATLPADTSCQVMVQFAPNSPVSATGILKFVDQAGTQTATLTGTGQALPTDGLNPASVSFPATAVGQISASMPVVLTNNGDLPLTSIAASVSGAYQTSNNCGTQLAGHSACSISVVFAPTATGVQTGVLTVSDALRTQTVSLSGTGIQPPALSVSPASLSFPNQDLNVASAPATLTITNAGGEAAANIGFALTGAAASSFSCGTTVCSAATCGASLAVGASCTVQVVFTPAEAGGSAAALTIVSSTGGANRLVVQLNGAGLAPAGLNVSPPQLTFAATVVGSSSAAQTVTVSNSSSVAASPLVLAATAGFALTANNCGSSLAAGASCTVGVVAKPAAVGADTGTLNVSSPAISNTAAVLLSGSGAVAAGIQVMPAMINFAVTGVGLTSNATTVKVTNTGATTALSGLALTVPAGFVLVNNTCAASLGPGVSCTAGVEFAPTAAGPLTGNLTVTSSSPAITAAVALQGMGFDFKVAFSGAGAQTVAGGTSASYTVVITPLSGAAGSFTFACASLPANALCMFNPNGESLTAGTTGNVVVQVSTGNATALNRSGGRVAWGLVPLLCGLLLWPLRGRRGVLQGMVLLIALGAVVAGVSSCAKSGGGTGGGGGGTSGAGGGAGTTPAGTYSIPVTVTSTGVSHSVTATLIVD
jgi:hypothetical protein